MTSTPSGFRRALLLAGGACAALAPGLASAQSAFSRDANVGVRERSHPEYDALGIRAGGFTLFPEALATVSHQSNIYASQFNPVSDQILELEPSARLESNWGRHALTLNAQARSERHSRNSSEDASSWGFGAAGRVDVSSSIVLNAGANFSHEIEARSSSANPLATARPVQYDITNLSLSALKEFNRLRISGQASQRHYSYDNAETPGGATIFENFRNRRETVLGLRADYAISPDTAVFISTTSDRTNYRRVAAVNRNSRGGTVLAGVNFQVTQLIDGEASIGYMQRSFSDVATDDLSSLAYNGRVTWYPDELYTVSLSAERTVNDSGLSQAVAYVSDRVALQADYEMLRNLIVTGTADFEQSDFQGFPRTDKRFGLGISGAYSLNRTTAIAGSYTRLEQTSSGASAGPHFTDQRVGISLILRR